MPALFHSSLLYPPTYSLHIYQSFTIRGKIRFGSVPNSCSSSALCQPQLIKNFNFWEHLIEEDAFSIGFVEKPSILFSCQAENWVHSPQNLAFWEPREMHVLSHTTNPTRIRSVQLFSQLRFSRNMLMFFLFSGMLLMKKTVATRQMVIWSCANINGWQIELFYSGQIAP